MLHRGCGERPSGLGGGKSGDFVFGEGGDNPDNAMDNAQSNCAQPEAHMPSTLLFPSSVLYLFPSGAPEAIHESRKKGTSEGLAVGLHNRITGRRC